MPPLMFCSSPRGGAGESRQGDVYSFVLWSNATHQTASFASWCLQAWVGQAILLLESQTDWLLRKLEIQLACDRDIARHHPELKVIEPGLSRTVQQETKLYAFALLWDIKDYLEPPPICRTLDRSCLHIVETQCVLVRSLAINSHPQSCPSLNLLGFNEG